MKRHHSIWVLLIALCLGNCSGPEAPPGLDEKLAEEIPRLMELADVPGLSLAVIRDGRILYAGAFGVRSTETGEPIDTDTIFEAASLTKTITAAAAMKLMEAGELDLDTPLCEYLPYPKLAGDERYKKLTARLVLTHTTGLPNWGNRLIREPGELYGYSGEGFLYLGRVIEEISGQGLDEFAHEHIFTPLGMLRTSYVWTEEYAANGAPGHDRYGVVQELRKRTEPNGGASLITTPTDYARYVCALLNDEVLKPETIAQMLSPQVQAAKWGKTELDEHIFWGWGWGVQPGDTGYGFWHWGNNGDLRGYTVAYKDKKEGLVFFSNSENAFALADPLVALITEEPQWSMVWLDWERHDDPERMARRSVEKALLEEGPEAGMMRLKGVMERFPELFGLDEMGRTAGYLVGREKFDSAAAVFSYMLEIEPKRMQAWEGLGMVEMEQGSYPEAIRAFEKAMEINPSRRMAKTAVPWIRDLMALEEKSVEVPDSLLEKYAGSYGPRKITLREGHLFYQREGRPEYRLKPLDRNTFLLEGYPRFRLRFVTNDQGEVTAVRGLYIEGRTDTNKRGE